MRKKMLFFAALCLTLCLGLWCCASETEVTLPPECVLQPPAEPVPAMLLNRGEPWDEDGVLLRLPLELAEEHTDLGFDVLADRLIFWEYEYGSEWLEGLRLWAVEPRSGTVTAHKSLSIEYYLQPQIQGDRIIICDSATGDILTLNRDLQIQEQWHREPDWNPWILGEGATLYRIEDGCRILREDLVSGEEQIILDRASGLYHTGVTEEGIALWFTDVDLGLRQVAFLDFEEGLLRQPFGGSFNGAQYANGFWLCENYSDRREFRMGSGAGAWDGSVEGGLLSLLPEGYLLEESIDGEHLYLYDLEGGFLAGCSHTREGSRMNGVCPRWCRALGGYLFLVWDDADGRSELILWRLESSEDCADLRLTPADLSITPEQELDALRLRAEEMGEEYGLKIWIAGDCQTEYDDFTAALLREPVLVEQQLDILERALSAYPEGFFYQLRYDTYQQIHIQLISELTAKPHYGTGGSYGGFAQPKEGFYLVVINCDFAAEGTYYHEFSHIIDDYLEWDSWQREDSLYSEDGWLALNPEGFDYTYDYAQTQCFTDDWDQYFIDEYAMINSTEDRARIMEYGMMEYMDWRFAQMPGAVEKLRYYSQCIREAFDTTSWPERLAWEQYIP